MDRKIQKTSHMFLSIDIKNLSYQIFQIKVVKSIKPDAKYMSFKNLKVLRDSRLLHVAIYFLYRVPCIRARGLEEARLRVSDPARIDSKTKTRSSRDVGKSTEKTSAWYELSSLRFLYPKPAPMASWASYDMVTADFRSQAKSSRFTMYASRASSRHPIRIWLLCSLRIWTSVFCPVNPSIFDWGQLPNTASLRNYECAETTHPRMTWSTFHE